MAINEYLIFFAFIIKPYKVIKLNIKEGSKMTEEKIMHYANFNITFGEKEEPMLEHFRDIIFPAFTGEYKRGKEDEYPIFTLSDVKVKKNDEGEFVLVGNYIKETEYNVHTTIKNGELTPTPAKVPTAPYSRFIVFLKNHRMILVRNESLSPDIRSFQATVRSILNQYVRMKNKQKDTDKLPYAIVNIVDMPLKEDIETILKEVEKVNWVRLRFFPLNNDLNQLPFANDVREEMRRLGCNTANTQFNSPDSKEAVQRLLEDTTGLAKTTMLIKDETGETKTIKEETFSSNKKIPFGKDIADTDDEYLIAIAQKDDIINKTSEENEKLYKKWVEVFARLFF